MRKSKSDQWPAVQPLGMYDGPTECYAVDPGDVAGRMKRTYRWYQIGRGPTGVAAVGPRR